MNEKQQMRTVAIMLAVVALILVAVVALIVSSGDSKTPVESTGQKTDFVLQSTSGEVSLHQFRGKVVLLFFGYTHCPDVCPTTMTHVADAMDMLSAEEQRLVQPIFITVDPERDTVEHLGNYVAFFHPKLIGLSGTREEIKAVTKKYSVEFFVDQQSGADRDNYLINHSSRLFLIDKSGEVSDMMSSFTEPADIAGALRKYISR